MKYIRPILYLKSKESFLQNIDDVHGAKNQSSLLEFVWKRLGINWCKEWCLIFSKLASNCLLFLTQLYMHQMETSRPCGIKWVFNFYQMVFLITVNCNPVKDNARWWGNSPKWLPLPSNSEHTYRLFFCLQSRKKYWHISPLCVRKHHKTPHAHMQFTKFLRVL